jgi:N-methylhydantoinase A
MRIGIDIGGTFTDLVAETDDGIVVVKVPSTPSDPSRAFTAALGRVDGEPDEVLHGTTVGTNAVLTRTGADIAFIGTAGFADLLYLARQDRPSLYDLRARRPAPLVARERCRGVVERLAPDGSVLRELDEDQARATLRTLRGVDGVAVTLLHSYAEPSHERRLAELVREELDVPASLSSDILPEFREYERASTTALNAYVQPAVSRYLQRIDESSSRARVGVMWSGGGVRSIARTIDRPVHTLYSGPAAGVLGAVWVAERCGIRDVVTLDMGGTSADVALVEDGVPEVAEQTLLDGLPFKTPSIDVLSVGAGGGSIAWIDDGGALRVGPRSAGADPGPACYGRGGTEPTVTDAQCVLGYLGPALAGGELALDVDAARAAVERLPVDLPLGEKAHGILRVVRTTMARAVRSVSIERGRDIRRYALLAFGGAGPLHATALARELGMSTVIVPPSPGALAALGLLVAAKRADASVSRPGIADGAQDAGLRTTLSELEARVLDELGREGVARTDARTSLVVDCRYEGQSHELRIPVQGEPSFARIREAFHEAHRERFGFARTNARVEAITYRATALGPRRDVTLRAPAGTEPRPASVWRIDGRDVPVYERAALPAGVTVRGPAIFTELDSTTWLDGDSSALVHPSGALIVSVS